MILNSSRNEKKKIIIKLSRIFNKLRFSKKSNFEIRDREF